VTLLVSPALARTWQVQPDGSGDVPTIAAALDSAVAGDTVLLGCGTYYEHDLVLRDGVALTSETGAADCATIDALGLGRVASGAGLGPATTVAGITFTGGFVAGTCPADSGTGNYCMGGGLLLVASSPQVSDCAFVANSASDNGGGVSCLLSSPVFTGCEFRDNSSQVGAGFISAFAPGAPVLDTCVFTGNAAGSNGGAIYMFGTDLTVTSCSIVANAAPAAGGAIYWISGGRLGIDRTIIAFNEGGEAIHGGVGATGPVLTCTDIHGNAGGDWTGIIAGQAGTGGNLAADPLFCAPESGDLSLRAGSPCVAAPGCGRMGALPAGCAAVGAESAYEASSWGAVKVRYR
jgi:predicted outer membrane repeat protein